MKRFLLAVTMTALGATAAEAGPLLNRLAANCEARQQARAEARYASRANCPAFATPVRTAAYVAADRAGQVIESQPVRTAVVQAAYTFGTCVNGICK